MWPAAEGSAAGDLGVADIGHGGGDGRSDQVMREQQKVAVKDQSWERTYPGRRDCLSGLRRDVREVLVKSDCPGLVIDNVVHAVSELGANAVEHTPSGWNQGFFIVRVFAYVNSRRPYVWAEVENEGFGDIDLTDLPSRHGLDIVRRLVSRLGTERGIQGRVVYVKAEYSETTGEIKHLLRYPEPDPGTPLALNCHFYASKGLACAKNAGRMDNPACLYSWLTAAGPDADNPRKEHSGHDDVNSEHSRLAQSHKRQGGSRNSQDFPHDSLPPDQMRRTYRACISHIVAHKDVVPTDLRGSFQDFYEDIKTVIEARENKRMEQVNPPSGQLEIGNLESECEA